MRSIERRLAVQQAVGWLTIALIAIGAGPAGAQGSRKQLAEKLRAEIDTIVVVGGTDPADKEITGTYEEVTPGLYGGISQGAALGSPSMEVGPVTVSFPIPVLTLPGAIAGGISGKAKRDLQEFRDALADELAGAANQPLNNRRLALGVYRNLERLPELESALVAQSTPIPEDSDAVLYVSIDNLSIDVDGADAILTTSASISLRNKSDDSKLFSRVFAYQDRAALTAWTENNNALFRDYANFALHYLGREIAAVLFDRVNLRQELTPRASKTLDLARRNDWQGKSKSLSPTFAWELKLLGGENQGARTETIDETAIAYDVEVYDNKRLVYARTGVTEPAHTIASLLEPCITYRWSVRPSYRLDEGLRFGDWMRMPPSGQRGAGLEMAGRNAAKAPAYIQDFATLSIACSAD